MIPGGAGGDAPDVEAGFVASLAPRSVLDAGCGTGRVALALARRGIAVAGVDRDPEMIRRARRQDPDLEWHQADLATVDLSRRFDVVLLAGNVMIFLTPGSEGQVLRNLARHLAPDGALVAGFHLSTGYLQVVEYDRLTAAAGLVQAARFGSWNRAPWTPAGDYVVAIHRHQSSRGRRL